MTLNNLYKIAGGLCFSLLLLTACQEDVEVRDKNGSGVIGVLNSIESEGKFSQFYRAIGSNGLNISDELNGSGPSYEYTIFAPTNAAIDAFLANYDTYDDLGSIPDNLLRSLIDYHVVRGSYSSAELGSAPATEQGGQLTFNGTTVTGANNSATIAVADRAARNGFLHELDAVLVPPTFPTQNILQIAGGADFTSLAAAVGRFPDLVDAIDGGSGAFTVLAPTNAAFAEFLTNQGFASLADVPDPLLRTVLEYHVIEGPITASDVVGSQTTLSGESLDLDDDTDIISTPDVGATNGVVQVIDEVLVPPSLNTVAGILLTNPNFSTLAAALVAKDLITPLSSGAVTVFAPNNAAFAAAGVTDPSAAAASLLTYHVVTDSLSAAAIVTGFFKTINGASVVLSNEGGVTVDGVPVITADLKGTNGYVHEIGSVLSPPAQNIVTLAAGVADLSDLVLALQKSGLDTVLTEGGPYTVFAPSNAAFAAAGV
ncbi:MAG: fasciclin domain-containing protein, partial [Tunicatimonas sp.]